MLKQRDLRVIDFIERFQAATTEQIIELFFQYRVDTGEPINNKERVAQKRLSIIVKKSDVKRDKDPITGQYIYYVGRKAQLQHKLIRTELYVLLSKGPGEILKFIPEYRIENLRADAFSIYKYKNNAYLFFVEVQVSKNYGIDIDKYEKLYATRKYPWPKFPRIVAITDRNQRINSRLKLVRISTNLKNWEDILK